MRFCLSLFLFRFPGKLSPSLSQSPKFRDIEKN